MLKHMPEHQEAASNLFWKRFLVKNVGLFTHHKKLEKKVHIHGKRRKTEECQVTHESNKPWIWQ